MKPIAHTPPTPEGDPHDLAKHLRAVAALAEDFARCCGGDTMATWVRAAGLWHDLGKYNPEFQRYLLDCIAARNAGTKPKRQQIDHSTAGAIHAVQQLGPRAGLLLAYAIAGHHAGLPDYPVAGGDGYDNAGRSALSERLRRAGLFEAAMQGKPPSEVLDAGSFTPLRPDADLSIFVRMIFSCLIDADRLDTEAYLNPKSADLRRQHGERHETPQVLDARLAAYIVEKIKAAPDTPINRLRQELLADCSTAAPLSPGLFSLTAPTGLGKTLSGLTFCLKHAAEHGKNRIIYVAPYTSIIEQTAAIYRDALGEHNVLEHHSAYDPAARAQAQRDGEPEDDEAEPNHEAELLWRLSVENWDAPVIVTTAVQFFESLHAAETGRCRKLHRIANSVVFLDEAQLIPSDFLDPILRSLTELLHGYGVTLVLSTATQPALDPQRSAVSQDFRGISGPPKAKDKTGNASKNNRTEIVADVHRYHVQTRRFVVELPQAFEQGRPWEDLAAELASPDLPEVLCIVNTRASARDLHALMAADTHHLSATMCPQHRFEVIAAIKRRLKDRREGKSDEAVRVISTQLVEAGVDLDFAVVFRALAGLDSLAQSAGRCNREGLLAMGRFVVFMPAEQRLPPSLRGPARITQMLLKEQPDDPFAPDQFDRYFRKLFWTKGGDFDAQGIGGLLPSRLDRFRFRSASDRFRLIEDFRESVIVPWGEAGERLVVNLRLGPAARGLNDWRRLLRTAQRYTVGVSGADLRLMMERGGIEEVGRLRLTDLRFYSSLLGISPMGVISA